MCRAAFLLALGCAGCAATGGWSAREAADASLVPGEVARLARDLAAVLAEEWPPAWTVVRVAEGPVNGRLEAALRDAGYAIAASEAERALDVAASIEAVRDSELVCAGLAAGAEWRVDRLYERGPSGALRPTSGYTIRGQRGGATRVRSRRYAVEADSPVDAGEGEGWPLPAEVASAAVAAEPESPAKPSEEGAAVARERPAAEDGARALRVEKGSLKANVERLLGEFGYRLGAWPGSATHVWDGVLAEGYAVDVEGMRGVLELLRGYGLGARVREVERTVDFEDSR